MLKDRKVIIATKHGKEKVIAPILEKEFGLICTVDLNLDTDELGTFTGEVARKDDPITTARNKCKMAMELSNCDMAIASEGSFGPHPDLFFVPADDEFLLFMDKKNDLEIVARELTTETNFRGAEIHSERELKDFANIAKFPSHALILRRHIGDFRDIKKGISDWSTLQEGYRFFMNTGGKVYAETDMRAMHNPTRMLAIERAAQKLAVQIKSLCPQCHTPGFCIKESKKGLPCEVCDFPTRSILCSIYTCKKCNFSEEKKYPNGKMTENPMHCDLCNP